MSNALIVTYYSVALFIMALLILPFIVDIFVRVGLEVLNFINPFASH